MTLARLEFRLPSPWLRDIVRQHQVIRLNFAPGDPVPPKPYWPRPAAAPAFYLRSPETVRAAGAAAVTKPRAVLIGQPTVVTWRQGGHDFAVYQIEFQPGALHRLTGILAQDLTDGWIDAEAVLPASFRALVRQLEDLADGDAEAMIAAAEAWLWAAWSRVGREARAVDLAARWLIDDPGIGIDRVAGRLSLSARHVRRVFPERIGVSPKLLARVARFDSLVRARNRAPEEDWLTAAVWAGYYDYQHLRRDFHQFTLLGPTEFLAMEQAAPERGFGLREV
ncbi:helix-turn-helix domain-containing protein [Phenylobacterium sp.]|uniref:helix-turn-helix domain-containing protein n=1 Tax=Phenylobacterium sp. TaxID=1871053 RepID=UPI003D2A4DAB